jgi:hypothetical protein
LGKETAKDQGLKGRASLSSVPYLEGTFMADMFGFGHYILSTLQET